MLRSLFVYVVLLAIKLVGRVLYRYDVAWIGDIPQLPWRSLRLVVFLHHTSLYEPLFAGVPPNSFLWRAARVGVIPAAEKTMERPVVGRLFRMVARDVVPITRVRDASWSGLLAHIDDDSMVIILPEGRMMRRDGLDRAGNPMTVRGGISDILRMIGQGRMLIAYSGGLHHVQTPGDWVPRLFQTLRIRLEVLEIEDYVASIGKPPTSDEFRRAVRVDLERRRDACCP